MKMKAVFRKIVLILVLVTGWGQAAEPPNLLVILVDDLGYGDLSCYGAEDLRTPAIDALAAGGMTYSRFYANCNVCSPTRASLMTGRYPDRVGVPGVIRTHAENSWGYLAPGAVTLPQALSRGGYHTALVGKWHLGLRPENHPNRRGFDFFHGFLGDMMDDYLHHRRHGVNYMRRNQETIDPPGHATDLFTQWACEYLRQRAEHPKEPFFLYLAYNAPHTPIQPPPDWLERVRERRPGMSADRARLVAFIEHLDQGIGTVLDTLADTGMAEHTLVVFTSDNGGQLNVGASNGSLRGGKQDMYEGGLRVPACMVWPGHIQPGSRNDQVWMTMDIMPTLLEAAGLAGPVEMDGISFLAEATGSGPASPTGERTLFWTRREGGARYQGQDYTALRRGAWKLLHNTPFQALELYHLDNDPGEQQNLAESSPKVRKELEAQLRKYLQRGGSVPWQPPAE